MGKNMSKNYAITMDELLKTQIPTYVKSIHIHQLTPITNEPDLIKIQKIFKDLNKKNIIITFHAYTLKNLNNLLDYLTSVFIYLNTSNDFSEFLDFDNHINIAETKNKHMWLYVNGNNNINIDGITPFELPLAYRIVTYYPTKNNT